MDLARWRGLVRGRVLVFTGAGVSVASGLETFRGPGGMYEGTSAYDLASPEGFARDPVRVWNWYGARIRAGRGARPNPAHAALAELEGRAASFALVTSNVDSLHQQAGSRNVFRLHGRIDQVRGVRSGRVFDFDLATVPEAYTADTLPRAADGELFRPNVVWFGERPWAEAFEAVAEHLPRADAVLEVGVSGVVGYGFPQAAVRLGKPVLRINPEPEPERGVDLWPERAEIALPRLLAQPLE